MLALHKISEKTGRRQRAGASNSTRLSLALLTALSAAWVDARAAYAASPATDAPEASRREARSHYEAGVAAYRQGRFRDAVAAFMAADRLLPRPALSYNIAKAYARLSDTARALAYYREYLRRDPNAPNAATVRSAVAALEKSLSQHQLQQLTVLSEPANAAVSIDGRALGTTPWTGELRPGQHQLELKSENGPEQVFSIDLPSEHAVELNVRLSTVAGARTASLSEENTLIDDDTSLAADRRDLGAREAAPRRPSAAVLIAGGALTLVGVGMGVGFELAAQHEDSALTRYKNQLGARGCVSEDNAAECQSVRAAANQYDRDRTLAIVGFAGASASAVGTLVYWLWTASALPKQGTSQTQHFAGVRLSGAPTLHGGTVGLSGTF
jgi:tetratricopeptide (TPR) repeat protein